ncbi:MAG: hypothetical protein IJS03_09110 [Eubacterium sp.]|nr:hypothetical protein [Eubacterium sp.]
MKKILSILICISLILASVAALAACSKQTNEKEQTTKQTTEGTSEANNNTAGGWSKAESPVITDDIKKVFKKATAELTGVEYEPVAYVASQVVAGTNHCVLCKATATVPNAPTTYAFVYIYEDLKGNAEVSKIVSSEIAAVSSTGDGGWVETQTPEMTDKANKALEKACETLTGAEYTPIALLATQLVAGTNYRILCESTPSVPNAESGYVIVTVYADLEGNAEITDTAEFYEE